MDFTLFIFADFELQNMNSQFHAGSFEIVINQELWVLAHGTDKIVTGNHINVLSPFTIGYTKSISLNLTLRTFSIGRKWDIKVQYFPIQDSAL